MMTNHSRRNQRNAPPPPPVTPVVTKHYKDDFASLNSWQRYDSAGQDGAGRRLPGQCYVSSDELAILGDAAGNTGGVQLLGHPIYHGRVDVHMIAPAGAGQYHPVALLWGQGSGSSVDAVTGEIDFVEFWNRPSRDINGFTLHYGDGTQMIETDKPVSGTLWHTYSVIWTPTEITGLIDGSKYFSTTDTAKFPKVPMDLCLQLDWFPKEHTTKGSAIMYVDSIEISPL